MSDRDIDPAWLALGAKVQARENASPGDDAFEEAIESAKLEPGEWFRQRNPVTKALARDISQDTGIPPGSPGGKNQHNVAAQLLRDFEGDFDLLQRALGKLRRVKELRGIELYVLRKMLQNEASRMRRSEERSEQWLEEAQSGEVNEETVECSVCGLSVYNYSETDDGIVCIDCGARR